jgi:hypothetical protein
VEAHAEFAEQGADGVACRFAEKRQGGFRRDERDLDVFAVLLEVGCGEDVRRKMTYS